MDITYHLEAGLATIECEGPMRSADALELREIVLDALAGVRRFSVNLKAITAMDEDADETLDEMVQEVKFMDGTVDLIGHVAKAGR